MAKASLSSKVLFVYFFSFFVCGGESGSCDFLVGHLLIFVIVLVFGLRDGGAFRGNRSKRMCEGRSVLLNGDGFLIT